jgi:hypothetical protein
MRIIVNALAGNAVPLTNGVMVMTGMPIMRATPQQTSGLPGAPLATGIGAGVNGGLAHRENH